MAQAGKILASELFLGLNRSGPVPLYFQVAQRIEAAIANGQLPPGARLENEISLAARLSLSRPTIRRAIQDLVDRGLLVRRRGIGTQVVFGPMTRKVELTSLYDDLAAENRHPTTRVLSVGLQPAPARVATLLDVPEGDEVFRIHRVRYADGVAMAVMENYLPADFADITAGDLEQFGLYQLLSLRGVITRVAKQHIGAASASRDVSALLGIAKGGPVLTMERTSYDNSGRAIEFGSHHYRPDCYSFEVTLVGK